ncbi:MAG: RimK family protein [Nitrospirota bacterium]
MHFPVLIVVNDPKDWPLKFEGAELIAARTYLTDSRYAEMQRVKVFNLCRSYKYQSIGYYVSLLAAARGHKPIPDITTVQDLKSQAIIRIASEELDELIQKSLATIQSREFILSIYFGHNIAKRHERLSQLLFKFFQVPFLRAYFVHSEKTNKWYLKNFSPIDVIDIPGEHQDFVIQVAKEFFERKKRLSRPQMKYRYDLAILYNHTDSTPPSNPIAIQRFIKAAESLGIATELIQKEDYGRIAEFDALFIRETTNVNHHTYRFARRAAAEGLIVVDDPESILKCTNKVFLAELLLKYKIPVPKTIIVHRNNIKSLQQLLGFPCILKKPDSSFSQGVIKADNEDELRAYIEEMLDRSEMVIAQEFMMTPFDWRVGIFNREPLYVCKYFMAEKHWQIVKRDSFGIKTEGDFETLAVEDAPKELIHLALRSANLIGDGLYGVDIKQVGRKFYVIEVNDNPNIDAEIEDAVLKDELYRNIMKIFLKKIEQKKIKK